MLRYIFTLGFVLITTLTLSAQNASNADTSKVSVGVVQDVRDGYQDSHRSVTKPIPYYLPSSLFIPRNRLVGPQPWIYAPMTLPVVYVIPLSGFNPSIGFGEYTQTHPDHFFSTLEGRNIINIPNMFVSRQMMIGNTLRIGGGLYFLSGILYGAQMGVMGNNWGIGTREGLLYRMSDIFEIALWSQNFQSIVVYSPVIYPHLSGNGAAILMPATPEVFSFGVQASFVVGGFIVGIGTSVSPVPFQNRHHSELR